MAWVLEANRGEYARYLVVRHINYAGLIIVRSCALAPPGCGIREPSKINVV